MLESIFNELSCRNFIKQFPKLSQRDGGPIQRTRSKIVGGNLTIESLRRADFGFYQCVASNEVATISASTQLIVEGTQPHAPYNVSGTATQFAVSLTWLPGYSGGPDYKQDYTIWWVYEIGLQVLPLLRFYDAYYNWPNNKR